MISINFFGVINSEKPLAIYLFSKNQKDSELFLNNTTSGGYCFNDCILHAAGSFYFIFIFLI